MAHSAMHAFAMLQGWTEEHFPCGLDQSTAPARWRVYKTEYAVARSISPNYSSQELGNNDLSSR